MPQLRSRGALSTLLIPAAVLTMPVWSIAAPSTAAASSPPSDPLGCAEQVFDPAGYTSTDLEVTAARVADVLDADLHVRVEGSLDGDIDSRERRLENECQGWLESDGLRASNLLVVMVSPSERSTSIYYGGNYSDTLVAADSQIQEFVMNPRFQEGLVERGLIEGLLAIKTAVEGGGVPQAQEPIYDPTDFTYRPNAYSSSDRSSGSDFPVGAIVAVIVLVLLVSAISSWAKANGWATSDSSSGYRRSWSSSSRRSSSSGRSSSRRSSSSSRRSGGGGSSSRW